MVRNSQEVPRYRAAMAKPIQLPGVREARSLLKATDKVLRCLGTLLVRRPHNRAALVAANRVARRLGVPLDHNLHNRPNSAVENKVTQVHGAQRVLIHPRPRIQIRMAPVLPRLIPAARTFLRVGGPPDLNSPALHLGTKIARAGLNPGTHHPTLNSNNNNNKAALHHPGTPLGRSKPAHHHLTRAVKAGRRHGHRLAPKGPARCRLGPTLGAVCRTGNPRAINPLTASHPTKGVATVPPRPRPAVVPRGAHLLHNHHKALHSTVIARPGIRLELRPNHHKAHTLSKVGRLVGMPLVRNRHKLHRPTTAAHRGFPPMRKLRKTQLPPTQDP